MRVERLTFTDDEEIDAITVTMSLREAAAIHAIAGHLNGHADANLYLRGEESLYEALNDLFCKFYENGYPPGAPRGINLATINEAPG